MEATQHQQTAAPVQGAGVDTNMTRQVSTTIDHMVEAMEKLL